MKQNPPPDQTTVAVALNSVRHGLRTVALVIPGHETETDWDAFSTDAHADLAPEGAIEYALAQRVVELLWRIRRVARAEHLDIVEDYQTACREEQARVNRNVETKREPPDNYYASGLSVEPRKIAATLVLREATLNTLSRYEAHLSKQLYAAMHELEVLQARRSGQMSPLLRLRIQGSTD